MFVVLSLYLIPKSVQTLGYSFESIKLKTYHHQFERLKCSICIDTNRIFLDIPAKIAPLTMESLGGRHLQFNHQTCVINENLLNQNLQLHNQTCDVNEVIQRSNTIEIPMVPYFLTIVFVAFTVLVTILWYLRFLKHNSTVKNIVIAACPSESWNALLPSSANSHTENTTSLKFDEVNIEIEAGSIVSSSDSFEAPRMEVAEEGEFVWPRQCYHEENSTPSFPSTVSDVSTEVDYGVTATWEVCSVDSSSAESMGSMSSLGNTHPIVLSSCTSLVHYHPQPRLTRDYYAAIHTPAIMAPNLMTHMLPPLGTAPFFHTHHSHQKETNHSSSQVPVNLTPVDEPSPEHRLE